jgi:hypothetical protein
MLQRQFFARASSTFGRKSPEPFKVINFEKYCRAFSLLQIVPQRPPDPK